MLVSESRQSLERSLGWFRTVWTDDAERAHLRSYIALQLASSGLMPTAPEGTDHALAAFSSGLLESLREKNRLLSEHRAPVDSRIENFLNRYFADSAVDQPLRLPDTTLVLDRHGMARKLSLPIHGDQFSNALVSSYRCHNGVLHNPASDRRTTAGTFHIVEGGLPIPGDKRAVPKNVFVRLFLAAMNPTDWLLTLPYTSQSSTPSKTWVSLLLRPLVCPEVPGYCNSKRMETRFFAPSGLVSNLDFVESIFGNAGDPLSPINDAALDVESWTGHTGCVILAPHLVQMTKRELGLPNINDATPRQRQDSMCWTKPDELYNDGSAFKVTCGDASGVVVTIIADNYFGYCKKEVKTQISYATNLMGGVEEEHAGGALAFASYSLGDEFQVNSRRFNDRTFDDVARDYPDFVEVRPEGYGIDKHYPSVIYIPENAKATLVERCIKWSRNGQEHRIKLSPDNVYVAPSGYKIRLEKHPAAPSWRLVGTVGEGIFCHKPCTVSGGGKSEISKSLRDYMLYNPIYVEHVDEDFATLQKIFDRDYQNRWHKDYASKPDYSQQPSRSILDPRRSLGSLIQLLTPSPEYSDEYNDFLQGIPEHIYAMALIIKRFMRPDWGHDWTSYFGVDIVNGSPGHELKFQSRGLVGTYLRVGLEESQQASVVGSRWRTFKLRQDFIAAAKVQREDDISASTVVPKGALNNLGPALLPAESYKFVANCEYRLFQRPDDAVHRGLDTQTEYDLSLPGNFVSNFQPLSHDAVSEIVSDVIEFDRYSSPMKELLTRVDKCADGFVVSSADPRLMPDGTRTKNPRYLQDRPDMVNARDTYVAETGIRLFRKIPADQPVHVPVGAVLSGRRNNPPVHEQGIRPLAVYSPLHYQQLPELMMDYICSLTGKSPSTTGAGSEGALTKGPFNMLLPSIDLNSTYVSMVLTGLGGFSTPAGHVGHKFEVGHDISLLIPEVWCRMGPEERDPEAMIANGMLEPLQDFQYEGKEIPASRLGFRITSKFVRSYLARVFDNPSKVFTEELLRPELQDLANFADGILFIAEAQQRVAQRYLDDGSYEQACPPIQALLSIMAQGSWNGLTASSPELRAMFTQEYLLNSDWYRVRLETKQQQEKALFERHLVALEAYLQRTHHADVARELGLADKLDFVKRNLVNISSAGYLDTLVGTIGADPL
jgi:phosphoenolpyruvate carboxykinase (diphosphate)